MHEAVINLKKKQFEIETINTLKVIKEIMENEWMQRRAAVEETLEKLQSGKFSNNHKNIFDN